jgi:hypothetical protein
MFHFWINYWSSWHSEIEHSHQPHEGTEASKWCEPPNEAPPKAKAQNPCTACSRKTHKPRGGSVRRKSKSTAFSRSICSTHRPCHRSPLCVGPPCARETGERRKPSRALVWSSPCSSSSSITTPLHSTRLRVHPSPRLRPRPPPYPVRSPSPPLDPLPRPLPRPVSHRRARTRGVFVVD